MKKPFIYFIFFCFCFLGAGTCAEVNAQNKKIDSLSVLLSKDKEDTNKINHLNHLSWEFSSQDPDTALVLCKEALRISEKINWQMGIGDSYFHIAWVYNSMGDHSLSLEFNAKALDILDKILSTGAPQSSVIDKKSRTLCNIGNVYRVQGSYPKALDYFFQSLKIAEELGNKYVQANNLGSIGSIYEEQKEHLKAIDHFFKALKLFEELGDKKRIATSNVSIGNSYYEQKNSEKALEYYFKALKMAEEIGHKRLQATDLGNIGTVYMDQGNYEKATEYDLKALKMFEELGAKDGIALNLANIGSLYTKLKKFPEAEKYLLKAVALSDTIGDLYGVMDANQNLCELYRKMGKYDKALDHYTKAMVVKDTLFNQDKNNEMTSKAMTYEFDKKTQAAKAEQDKKDLIAAADNKRKKIVLWSALGGLLLVIVFAGFIFRSLRETRRQKNEVDRQKAVVEEKNILIEDQKKQVEEKNKEMTDSIVYARRIQYALLASDSYMQKHLAKEYFVIFKPKDIVSGDFYWATRRGNKLFLAVCDSTGHGVPGAFMSLLNIAFLNEAINEKLIDQPSEIFNYVRKRLIQNISRDGGQDGMDGILACFDMDTNAITYAAANNGPVFVAGNEMQDLDADKMPIGKGEKQDSFNTYPVAFNHGNMLYLCTDGYADQFGGPKGKKFRHKQLAEKLLAISSKPMNEQKTILDESLTQWKGNLEQVDDILVIGIRL